jgi:hypothetical protein
VATDCHSKVLNYYFISFRWLGNGHAVVAYDYFGRRVIKQFS